MKRENMLKKASELASHGRSSIKSGKYEEALEDLNRAASIYDEQAEPLEQIKVLQEMADIYRLTERSGASLDIYSRLIGLFDKLGDPTEARN